MPSSCLLSKLSSDVPITEVLSNLSSSCFIETSRLNIEMIMTESVSKVISKFIDRIFWADSSSARHRWDLFCSL